MASTTRRRFLRHAATGALGVLGGLSWPRVGAAQSPLGPCDGWGALSAPASGDLPIGAPGWSCQTHGGYKVLDIWLDGGASPWETFWIPGASGAPDLAAMGVDALALDELHWAGGAKTSDPCNAPGDPVSANEHYAFGATAGGETIYWGPAAKPLWSRNDLMERCRVLTLGHPLLPHQAATPYGLAGLPLGNPRRAGTGAAVQRRHASLYPDQLAPVSYVFHSKRRHIAAHAAVAGQHPGSSRPVVVGVHPYDRFSEQLAREGISPASDALFDTLRQQTLDRMRWQGSGVPVRSAGVQSYRVASGLLLGAQTLQALFPEGLLAIDTSTANCPRLAIADSYPMAPHVGTELAAGAHLLSQDLARYVCVIDSGIAGMYDTHIGPNDHRVQTIGNLTNLCRKLARVIHHPTANPTGPIDLNDTLVVINSEFGRSPALNPSQGRDHWPYGYLSILLGGPIHDGTRGIRGALTPDGYAQDAHSYTPSDVRGALLLAAGVDPFAPGGFRVDDFSDALRGPAYTEVDIRERLMECCFGL